MTPKSTLLKSFLTNYSASVTERKNIYLVNVPLSVLGKYSYWSFLSDAFLFFFLPSVLFFTYAFVKNFLQHSLLQIGERK